MVPAMFIADMVCRRVLGYEMVITSCVNGKHSNTSRHYIGCAWDLRTWTSESSGQQINKNERDYLVVELKKALGGNFFVLGEKTHIHIAFKPTYNEFAKR